VRYFILWSFILSVALGSTAHAQFDDESESTNAEAGSAASPDPGEAEVEALYDKLGTEQDKKSEAARTRQRRQPPKDVTTLSELSNLAPFSDVAIIQRRFIPRTQRFEISASGMTSVNNPFFNNLGLNLRGAYFLAEKHGIELQYTILTATSRAVTDNLRDKRNVATSNLVKPKSYMGGAYKWTPIYGKITFLNRQIVPFDLFFTAGLGLTQTQRQGEPTLHLGTGQSFAITKSWAFRWDLVWNYYQADVESVVTPGASTTTSQSDLYLAVGLSFFFPEATYR